MKITKFSLFFACAAVASSMLVSQTHAISIPGSFSAQVEEDEIDPFGAGVDQAFFNVQGDDDPFTVYSIVDFSTAGIGPVSTIADLELDLTQSNAFFSASGALEFFLASDTRAVDVTDTARFISAQPAGANTGADVVGAAFGTLYPLGSGTFTVTATGDTDNFPLSLGPAAEAFALSQIASGGILRIVATPGDVGVQATYSGALSLIDSPPVLSFTVPEPTTLALAGFGLIGFALRRRS